MVRWNKLFNGSREAARDELDSLLPTNRDQAPTTVPATEVYKIALRLKYQLEQVIPVQIEEDSVTTPLSAVITDKVVDTARNAGGDEYKACVVFSLLVCLKWFRKQALLELWDADLHYVRAVACQVIAKRIIESEDDLVYLLEHVLLRRFAIVIDGEESTPANVIERAVDLHALWVIGSSGYQKCVSYLWKGWLVQDDEDPNRFIAYDQKTNPSYWAHLDPDRMRVPRYQNAVQIIFSLLFLALYTGAINTINPHGDLDLVEIFLYLFTLGFIFDEASKLWKVGRYYISFWNLFHSTMYALLAISFAMRMVAFSHSHDGKERQHYNKLSYNFLAFTAPMFWMRLMLYLDTYRFFGAMLVVVKIMMRESLIFFALLIFMLVGFFQAFIGMDLVDETLDATSFILAAMANTVMSSPDFSGFNNFAPPFGIILYYLFAFVVMVILLNILVALYNSAYSDITDNAIDEYMALFAAKCLQFVRAPDENVFIAPLNLFEILLVVTCEWWMPKSTYSRLNDIVMGALYSPLLIGIAALEQRAALFVRENRRKGEADEDTVEEWEQLDWKPEEDNAWVTAVKETSPDVRVSPVLEELKSLREEIQALKTLVEKQAQAQPK